MTDNFMSVDHYKHFNFKTTFNFKVHPNILHRLIVYSREKSSNDDSNCIEKSKINYYYYKRVLTLKSNETADRLKER